MRERLRRVQHQAEVGETPRHLVQGLTVAPGQRSGVPRQQGGEVSLRAVGQLPEPADDQLGGPEPHHVVQGEQVVVARVVSGGAQRGAQGPVEGLPRRRASRSVPARGEVPRPRVPRGFRWCGGCRGPGRAVGRTRARASPPAAGPRDRACRAVVRSPR
ncbi:hypothetical protein [Streptosporangium vulgare]|uniref:hypothetical protein n=1 Tax=Streptosporangium vulgare TaxID=46190 RepID=UPI0031D8328F